MSPPALDISALKILVVDDNKFMRLTVVSILRSFHCYDVRTATDGADAFKIMQNYLPDIIITGWRMLPLDGIEFTRILRAKTGEPEEMIPVIMMSAYSEDIYVKQARDAGVNEFLVKPLSATNLYLRLVEVIIHPRPFVRSKNFKGPCRHRHNDYARNYPWDARRSDDKLFDAGVPQDHDDQTKD
ncbi:hypothetical protein BEN30_02725 [Magnetovibrio blakemorei]|uniref:Response regulatory domain-containing protein n=2 Tax=Magnetovibrio blakemorei TaxID=28181 RepID=A0A1E5QBV1_9PROT|nr:hypothetical protein BEN30_02725 [Magnetovibrio blakemorei]